MAKRTMPKASRWGKIKAANLRAAVVADLLQNFNGPSGKESVNYKQNRYEILLSQISRLPQSAHKFEAKQDHFKTFILL